MTILQRVTVYNWSKELFIVGALVVYVSLYWFGVKSNERKVNKWVKSLKPVLEEQFYQFGTAKDQLYVSDSASHFSTYATGRLNVENLIAQFKLLGRDNFITLSIEYIFGFFFGGAIPHDRVDIVISPDQTASLQPGIFAIVNKDNMKDAREDNYFLSLTRTLDSTRLPNYFTFMTEAAELIELLFTPELKEAVEGAQHVLEYIAVTDQRAVRPEKVSDIDSSTRVIIALKTASTASDYEATKKIVNAAVNLCDTLVQIKSYRPELLKKIKSSREAEIKKVQKALDAQVAEDLAAKKAEAKRSEGRVQLSAAEQKKLAAKEERKRQKKMSKRQSVR